MTIQLFLSRPVLSTAIETNDVSDHRKTISLFNALGETLWTLVTSEGRSEARLWLCDAISNIGSITAWQKHDLFMSLLRSNKDLMAQVLHMVFEKRPRRVGLVLAKRSHLLEKFFRGHPKRIMQWFATFSVGGEAEHGQGAKALSQFAFVNRDICWEELVWNGKHGQSPAVVATKPHYFLDLDIQQTMENFIENIPDFWTSDEFSESLKDGEILSVNKKFFADLFIKLIYKENAKDVWEVISEFLLEESFRNLCQHLLIVLDEQELSSVLERMQSFICKKEELDAGNSSHWLEIVLSKCAGSLSMDRILLINALLNRGRYLLRLVLSDENQEDIIKIKDLSSQIYDSTLSAKSVIPISRECLKEKPLEALKWLGLLSWIYLYKMSEECLTLKSWESLFHANGIEFRKSDKFNLLYHDGSPEEADFDGVERTSKRKKHKTGKETKKKRRRDLDLEIFDDELLDINNLGDGLSLESTMGRWLLSVDGYSTHWGSVDLPEFLSKHCLTTWMSQIVAHLNGTG